MKKLTFAGIVLISLSLTGCVQEYQLSEDETSIAAEYMASVLLAQDETYKSSLLDLEQLEVHKNDAATNEKEEIQESTKEVSKEKDIVSRQDDEDEIELMNNQPSLSEVMGIEDFVIRYMDAEIHDVYPEDEANTYFSLTAREGYQLLVASFSVENKTKKDKSLNLKKAGINYQLDINVGTIYKPSLTLLENDLRYIDMTIGARKKETVLLVFEISKESTMKDVNLIISRGAKSEIIEIK